jgi:hypothetical protein
MSKLAHIFEPWDGNAETMAADLGMPGVTVRQWRNRESIPPKYWQLIIDKALARGHALSWQQFIVEEVPTATERAA